MNLLRIRLTPQRHSAAPLTHPSSKEGFVDPNESNESLKNLALMVLMGLDKFFLDIKGLPLPNNLTCKEVETKVRFCQGLANT